MFVLVFVTLFLMTRAGEYNDELMLDNQILHVGCFADESHEDANAMLCLRQVCRGLSHADKTTRVDPKRSPSRLKRQTYEHSLRARHSSQ